MTNIEASWIAGFFDGEGTVGIKTGHIGTDSRDYVLKARIVQCDEDILKWIKYVVGSGSIYKRPFKNKKWKTVWEWCCSGQDALKFFKRIYPFLRLKKIQADIAIRFGKTMVGRGYRINQKQADTRSILRQNLLNINGRGRINIK